VDQGLDTIELQQVLLYKLLVGTALLEVLATALMVATQMVDLTAQQAVAELEALRLTLLRTARTHPAVMEEYLQ
jgi:hypothetical protein